MKVTLPPPQTVLVSLTVCVRTHSASWSERSASSRICCVAPLIIMVHASLSLQPEKCSNYSKEISNNIYMYVIGYHLSKGREATWFAKVHYVQSNWCSLKTNWMTVTGAFTISKNTHKTQNIGLNLWKCTGQMSGTNWKARITHDGKNGMNCTWLKYEAHRQKEPYAYLSKQ